MLNSEVGHRLDEYSYINMAGKEKNNAASTIGQGGDFQQKGGGKLNDQRKHRGEESHLWSATVLFVMHEERVEKRDESPAGREIALCPRRGW